MNDMLSIRLGRELAEALQQESAATGLPKGEIARLALREHLRSGRDNAMVMARHFGAVAGPADLSTNRAYRRQWHKKGK